MRQEDLVGSLEVGKLADLIILDQNIFEVPITQISQTKVLKTFLEGEVVFER
jgi:predicted amidohydrolase YtcJ